MGFSYRKSVKMGPFRMTASKSGISYSVGVKGARVTKRANGKIQTTFSVPGTGLRYTSTSGTRKRPAQRTTARVPTTARPAVSPPKRGSHPPAVASPKPKPASAPKPTAAARQPRPPKPVRLKGRRYSVQPRIAAPWLLPFTIKGNLATVTVHPHGFHIERTGGGRIAGNRSSDISWNELVGIDFLDPSFFRNGHVHFATASDARGLTVTGNGNPMAASARNPHAITFAWHQSTAYCQLRGLLSGNAPVAPGTGR